MQFFAVLLVFVGILAILQYFVFGGITFFAIYNSQNSPSNIQENSYVGDFLNQVNSARGFSISVNDYSISDGKLIVRYSIKEFRGDSQEMNVGFSLINNDKPIEKGEQKVVIEANRENIFSIAFDIPQGYSSFAVLLEANNGNVVASTSKEIMIKSEKGISAYAVKDVKAETMPWLLFIVLALTIVVFVLRNITKRQAIHYFRRSHNKGLIGLEINTP